MPETALATTTTTTTVTTTTTTANNNFKAYTIRWYILTLFSMVSFGQIWIYSTWGPISISAEKALSFTQTDLALLPNWYNVGYFIALLPFIWLVQIKGMRYNVIVTALLVAAGASVRCLTFSTSPHIDRLLIHAGQLLNGLASPGTWFACTELSEIWFPPKERALATSIGLSAGSIGLAVSFIGPTFIRVFNPATNEDVGDAIRFLLYVQYFYAVAVLVMVIIYFPSHPTTPPSYTATVKRLNLIQGVRSLAKASQAWIMIGVYAVSTSVFTSFDQVMTQFLEPAMTEEETGSLGIVFVLLSIVAGPALSFTSPLWLRNHSKLVCVTLMLIGCCCLAILTLSSIFFQTLFNRSVIWTTFTIASIVIAAPQPIWWELSCEAAYPVAEATVSGISSLASCAGSWLFFFLYMFPSLGTDWPIWSLLITQVICLPALLIYKPSTKRTEEDDTHAMMTTPPVSTSSTSTVDAVISSNANSHTLLIPNNNTNYDANNND